MKIAGIGTVAVPCIYREIVYCSEKATTFNILHRIFCIKNVKAVGEVIILIKFTTEVYKIIRNN